MREKRVRSLGSTPQAKVCASGLNPLARGIWFGNFRRFDFRKDSRLRSCNPRSVGLPTAVFLAPLARSSFSTPGPWLIAGSTNPRIGFVSYEGPLHVMIDTVSPCARRRFGGASNSPTAQVRNPRRVPRRERARFRANFEPSSRSPYPIECEGGELLGFCCCLPCKRTNAACRYDWTGQYRGRGSAQGSRRIAKGGRLTIGPRAGASWLVAKLRAVRLVPDR